MYDFHNTKLKKIAALLTVLGIVLSIAAAPANAQEPASIIISGPAEVEQPPFMAVLSYQYAAGVFDQNGNALEGEEVEWEVSPAEAGSMTADGILNLKRIEGLDEITLTARSARNPSVVSQPYAVSVRPVAPYYRADKIDEDVTGIYTRADFARDLDAAKDNSGQDLFVLNFNNEGLQWTKPDPFLTIPSFRGREIKYNYPFYSVSPMPTAGMACNPSAGTHATYNLPSSSYKVLSIDESLLESYRPVAMGIVFCSGTKKTLEMIVYYSDGTDERVSFTVNTGKNSFCGFKAPFGSYIRSASILADTWSLAMDEMGFIIEEFYNVSIGNETPAGSLVINPDSFVKAGSTVTVAAASGWEISNVKFDGEPAEMVSDNTYEFIMPASNVTVTANANRLPERVDRVEISGPSMLEQPPFMAVLEYQYSARVLSQFGTEMENRRLRWSITPENAPGVSMVPGFGLLTLERADGMPESISIIAEDVESGILSQALTVTIKKTEPYYDKSKIFASINNDYTRDDFVRALNSARDNPEQDICVFNFNNKGFYYTRYAHATLSSHRGMQVRINYPINIAVGSNPNIAPNPSAGTHFHYHNLTDVRLLSFDESFLGIYRPVAVGFVLCESTNRTIPVDVVYSDGSSEHLTVSMTATPDQPKNYFYGFKAPDGHFVKSITIGSNGKWGLALDEIGAVLKEPDSLVMENEFPKFQWAQVSEQPKSNITKKLTLPAVFGRCSVEWASSDSEIISSVTGEVNKPQTPDRSNVTLTGTLKFGAISRDKVFSLKVPSLIEEDADRLTWQKLSSENINSVTKNLTLPSASATHGFAISWQSSDPSIISTDGVVKRPTGKLDKMVILTAGFFYNNTKYVEKTFEVTVSSTERDKASPSVSTGSGPGGGRGGYMMMPNTSQPAPVTGEDKPEPKPRFSDLGSVPWAENSIIKLAEMGAVSGVDGDRFDPDGIVTREQFIKMLVSALGLNANGVNAVFTDVNENDWYYEAVSAASGLGIAYGYDDGSFGVGKEITRQEMAVMAYRAALAANITLNAYLDEIEWSDGSEIAEYARAAINVMQQAGILSGFPGDIFNPSMNATRAQAAVMICRLAEVK